MPGNWQARFWRPVERGDPSAEFNGETHRGQQVTPALTLPQVRYGLSVLLLEVFCTPGIDYICRQVQRQLMRNELDLLYLSVSLTRWQTLTGAMMGESRRLVAQ